MIVDPNTGVRKRETGEKCCMFHDLGRSRNLTAKRSDRSQRKLLAPSYDSSVKQSANAMAARAGMME